MRCFRSPGGGRGRPHPAAFARRTGCRSVSRSRELLDEHAALKDRNATLSVGLLVLDFRSRRSRREPANVEETQAAFVLLAWEYGAGRAVLLPAAQLAVAGVPSRHAQAWQ